MELKITPSGQTIVKPTALGPVANTDSKLLIYGLFQKGRVLAQDDVELSADDLARSQRESRELDRIFSSTTRERLWQGGFQSPVPGRKASGSFGKRRIFNNQPRSPHSGEDFSAPTGTPVLATARGRVALAKDLFFLGKTVILDHGFGLYSFYGHLSSLGVEPGTNVQSGTVIGKVGATGRVTGPHLHWGVRLGDARVNPMELLALAR